MPVPFEIQDNLVNVGAVANDGTGDDLREAFLKINGMKPTDIGLRPDLTVRTCPVEIHTCLSSSNDPSDIGKC